MRCLAQVELAARQLCILQIIMGLFMGGQKQMEEREVLCIHTDGRQLGRGAGGREWGWGVAGFCQSR